MKLTIARVESKESVPIFYKKIIISCLLSRPFSPFPASSGYPSVIAITTDSDQFGIGIDSHFIEAYWRIS
jgi:hypothetical protein